MGFFLMQNLHIEPGSAVDDCHGQMNTVNSEKWVVKKLIPSPAPQSVIDLDNSLYHCLLIDKPPSAYTV
jgi:hypothetical protein